MANGLALGIVAGLIVGCGFALGLQPMLQFGGAHSLASGLGFTLGIVITELVTLGLLLVAVQVVLKLSRVPRMTIIVASAVAIHISWRTMLERADALALVPLGVPVATPVLAADDWGRDALDPGDVSVGAPGAAARGSIPPGHALRPPPVSTEALARETAAAAARDDRRTRPAVRFGRPETRS